MSEIINKSNELEIDNQKNNIDDSNLTETQKQEIKDSLLSDKESLCISVKNELKCFMEEEIWKSSEKWVWEKWIKEANEYFWTENKDWKFSKELWQQVVKFQKKNGLDVDWVIWPATKKMMENKEYTNAVPGAQDINEVYEKVSSSILNEYISKLESKEGINLSKEVIYDDIMSILGKTNEKLDDNIFAWDIELLKKNFLEPKDKWLKLVEYMLDKKFPAEKANWENSEIKKEDLDNIFSITKSSVDFLFDSTKDKSPDEIKKQINEFKKIDEVNSLFKKVPDLEKMFTNTLPDILKNTDKEKFWDALTNFYKNVWEDVLKFTSWEIDKKELVESNKKIINNFSKFLWEIVNEDQVDVLTKQLWEFSAIKNNDKVSSLLSLVNEPWISKEDKLGLTKKIISWLELVSRKEMKDGDINKYIWQLSWIIKDLSWKVPDEKLKDVIRKFYWLEWWEWWNESDLDSLEAAKLLWESEGARDIGIELAPKIAKEYLAEKKEEMWKMITENLPDSVNEFAKDTANDVTNYLWGVEDFWRKKLNIEEKKEDNIEEISIEDIILNSIRNWKVNWAIWEIWWKVVETLKKVAGIDLKNTIKEVRNELLSENLFEKNESNTSNDNNKQTEDTENTSISNIIENKTKLEEIEEELWKKIWEKFDKSMFSLIGNKINSKENNNLTKDELITMSLENLNTFLWENTPLLIDYAKELWFKIEWEKDTKNFKNIVENIIKDPWTKEVIWDMISDLWKEVKWKNVLMKIKQLINKTKNENWANLFNEKNKWEITEIAIDTVFDKILWDKNKIETTIQLLKSNLWIEENLSNQDATKVILALKNHIWKDDVKNIFEKYPKLQTFDLNSEEYTKMFSDLYEWVKNKPQFINDVLETWIVKTLNNKESWEKNNKQESKIEGKDINTWVDLLYTTLNLSNEKDMSGSLNKILKEIWLEELSNTEILWKNLWENIISVLKSVNKKELKQLLDDKNISINKLVNWNLSEKEKINIYTEIGTDLMKITDIKKFQSEFKWENLSSWEKVLVDLADEFQEVIKEKWDLIKSLTKKRDDIFDIYQWKIDINKVDPENIKWYWKDFFDLLNSIVLKMDEKYLSNLDIWSWGSDWKSNKIVDTFISSFKWENKWFITKGLFAWTIFNKWETLDNYFRDSESNRNNFGDTMYRFLYNHLNPIDEVDILNESFAH
jgi:hypothetical protein